MPLSLSDFSGGLNLRDSPNEIALNETPAALNWTLDVRGQARLRNGCLNAVALPGTSGKAAYPFYSGALGLWLCARESSSAMHLYSRPGDLSGSWTDRGALSLALSFPVAFIDFPSSAAKVVLTPTASASSIPVGISTFDGTTLTSVSTTIGGTALALWQNRVWLGGYPAFDATGNPVRLFASKIGDPTVWTGADLTTVDLRDKDASPLTGLGLAGGALIVFKKRSAYRVNDSATGAFTTIDSAAGCQGALAVVPLRGRLYTWGADSLYEWDGVGPGRKVGDKARPLFATDAALVGGVPGLCGGGIEDRALFAYPSSAGGNNDRLLEYDPEHRWLMKHQLASSSKDEISSFARKEADLYAAIRDGDVMFKVMSETPGADDGVLMSNNFRLVWLQPNGGKLARIVRAQIEGLTVTAGTTTLKVRVYKDWDTSSYDEYDLSTDLRGANANAQVETSIVRSLGHARSFSFEFVAGTAAGVAQVNSLSLEPISLER